MKKWILLIGCLLAASVVVAQHAHDDGGCTCPSCAQKKDGAYTLPGLKGLADPIGEAPACEEHDHSAQAGHDEHEGHDHVAEEAGHDDHSDCSHDAEGAEDHEGHDHSVHVEPDEHAGHDHAAEDAHAGCSHDAEGAGGLEVSAEMARKIGLKVSTATGGTITQSMTFPAEIYLNRDQAAAVSPRFPSVIRQVFSEIGDEVKKGDVLASLENRETLAVYTVSSPLDGVVVRKNAAVGESAGEERVLFEVANLSSVWADISVFPKFQHLIRKGMSVKFVAHDGHTAQGAIQYVSPLVSHETRTFTARCVLEGAREDFTPGAFVRAQIVTAKESVPVRVEREAVQMIEGQAVLFISDAHGFENRDVVVGVADEQFVEIKQGLAPGESYVSAGAFSLKAQMVTSGMDPHAGHGH